ncbi:hypothetical protein TREMEDRAFT_65100 [Tremella mesenterica DSM 1558]|uniref:uncharacterized protein n=1 Tax=Tremella mesenterica (strain ATCC 24925 / CBS 8224 / DSM 1558 / NBRC 9311 / NRRL Y-6157 / RJB 2259-6 / UBC 559-6) TaxID=578456 RepID=UPI00032C93D6|nr:uncharacterized protein TREMEDRAFT_65100 [Tremella mesenterica DSM 1558]EIW66706.1 hypothetical protein TREMEDRAFT_65100 [Tremella mesenterica DSM 1558]
MASPPTSEQSSSAANASEDNIDILMMSMSFSGDWTCIMNLVHDSEYAGEDSGQQVVRSRTVFGASRKRTVGAFSGLSSRLPEGNGFDITQVSIEQNGQEVLDSRVRLKWFDTFLNLQDIADRMNREEPHGLFYAGALMTRTIPQTEENNLYSLVQDFMKQVIEGYEPGPPPSSVQTEFEQFQAKNNETIPSRMDQIEKGLRLWRDIIDSRPGSSLCQKAEPRLHLAVHTLQKMVLLCALKAAGFEGEETPTEPSFDAIQVEPNTHLVLGWATKESSPTKPQWNSIIQHSMQQLMASISWNEH